MFNLNSSIVKASLVAGVMGFIMSFLANYFIVPMPESVVVNSIGNGLSGFMSGFFGLAIFLLKDNKSNKSHS